MIVGIENKKTIKHKTIKEGIYFYYDSESYLELLSLLQKWGFLEKKEFVNLDLLTLDERENININTKILVWKLSIKNLWFWYDLFPNLNFFLVK